MKPAIPARVKQGALNGYAFVQDRTVFFIETTVQLTNVRILWAVCCLALISFAIAFVGVQSSTWPANFTPEQITYLTLPDTRLQSKFYYIYCFAIFSFFLTAGLVVPGWFKTLPKASWQISSISPRWLFPWIGALFWLIVLLMYDLKARDFLLALFAAYLMAETIKGRFQDKTLVLALLALVITLLVLPFLFPHKIADGRLWTMDIHWSAVLGNGLYERAGEVSNFDAFSNYGVLISWLISISREYPFFETLGGTVTLLKVINLVFCAFIVAIVIQRVGWNNRRMILAAALLLLFLFSGMSSGFAHTFDTPNQLPIRFLMVPVSVFLAYYIAGRKLFAGAAIFGLIAPVLLFYNFETGIYCISALGFALFIENARKGLLNLIITGVVLTLCFSISGVIFIHLAFEGSLLDVIAHLSDIITLKVESGSSGFAGLSAYLFPPFVIVMIHSSILFAGYLLSVKDRTPLTAVEFQSIVLVGMIIAIGPYVMNRFHILNMWVPFLLYALVVLPKLTVKQRSQQIFWSFALIVLVIPFVFGNPVRRVLSNEFVAAVSDNIHGELTPCLDGLVASDALCQYVTDKANDLETLSQQIPGLQWMSGLSLNILRVTGLSPVLDHKAPFFFAHRDETRDLVLANLRQHEPIAIAIDNIKHGNVAGIPPAVGDFQSRLVRDAGYEIVEETEYWTIARKP